MGEVKNITDELKECEGVLSDIMNKFGEVLTEKGIEYSLVNPSEFVIPNETKDNIFPLFSEIDGVDENQVKMVLQVTAVKDKVFVRKLFE